VDSWNAGVLTRALAPWRMCTDVYESWLDIARLIHICIFDFSAGPVFQLSLCASFGVSGVIDRRVHILGMTYRG